MTPGPIDIKFSSDVSNNPSNPHMQRNQTAVKLRWENRGKLHS